MPDLSRPPLHTLPHDELIAKLKTLTTLRVVRDEESSTDWKPRGRPVPGLGDGAELAENRKEGSQDAVVGTIMCA